MTAQQPTVLHRGLGHIVGIDARPHRDLTFDRHHLRHNSAAVDNTPVKQQLVDTDNRIDILIIKAPRMRAVGIASLKTAFQRRPAAQGKIHLRLINFLNDPEFFL